MITSTIYNGPLPARHKHICHIHTLKVCSDIYIYILGGGGARQNVSSALTKGGREQESLLK